MDWVDSPDIKVECLNEEPSPYWSEWSKSELQIPDEIGIQLKAFTSSGLF